MYCGVSCNQYMSEKITVKTLKLSFLLCGLGFSCINSGTNTIEQNMPWHQSGVVDEFVSRRDWTFSSAEQSIPVLCCLHCHPLVLYRLSVTIILSSDHFVLDTWKVPGPTPFNQHHSMFLKTGLLPWDVGGDQPSVAQSEEGAFSVRRVWLFGFTNENFDTHRFPLWSTKHSLLTRNHFLLWLFHFSSLVECGHESPPTRGCLGDW